MRYAVQPSPADVRHEYFFSGADGAKRVHAELSSLRVERALRIGGAGVVEHRRVEEYSSRVFDGEGNRVGIEYA